VFEVSNSKFQPQAMGYRKLITDHREQSQLPVPVGCKLQAASEPASSIQYPIKNNPPHLRHLRLNSFLLKATVPLSLSQGQ
jgi:hypothetical protein